VAVAGGMESMSRAPYLLTRVREGYRLGSDELIDSMIHDGLWDAYNDYHMGCTGEVVAAKYGVSRSAQDEYAAESHRRAAAAASAGRFDEQVLPVDIPQRKGDSVRFAADEGVRPDSTAEALSRLRPAFDKDGTVTAGNASQISDGAAAVCVVSEAALAQSGAEPLARIVASATSGIEPELVMMAPMGAIEKLLERAGWNQDQVDLFEVNEAFSSQSVALCREIPLPHDKLNVNGGAVAIGHPIGASGSRLLTTLLYALKDRNLKRGVVSLCLGGGNAVAMAVERE